ncbi:MAG: NAD(P)/FAD-dependent oxidoreductase [Pseudomonadota bacterium]
MSRKTVTVVGGGPVGTLLAIALARHGYTVGLYEGRPDSRKTSIYQGRSINIALSDRGWTSLKKIGVSEAAKRDAIAMYDRRIHSPEGEISRIPYGKADEAIWSVSRGGINQQLLDIADGEPNITTYFEHRLVEIDFETASTRFVIAGGDEVAVTADLAFGADGANSKVRRLAHNYPRFSYSQTYMPQSYIELHIPAKPDGSHRIDPGALHIWPRKDFMLIALPNPDGTFTCTLFLDHEGATSFQSLCNRDAAAAFFSTHFADALDYLEDPIETFLQREPAPLFLVHVYPWSFNRKVGLIGDAAHAIVPYYGQGMNSGFEDVAELNDLIALHDHDWDRIFPAYEAARKPNGDAIAELSKRNFVEMSDLSGDPQFQLRKKIEAKFSDRFPDLWTPLYSMVTFSPEVPYAEALRVGDLQNLVMDKVMALPDIDKDWDQQYVMDRLFNWASESFGESA